MQVLPLSVLMAVMPDDSIPALFLERSTRLKKYGEFDLAFFSMSRGLNTRRQYHHRKAHRLSMWYNRGLPQWRVTNSISEQQHLGWSYKFQLKWFPIEVVGDHADFRVSASFAGLNGGVAIAAEMIPLRPLLAAIFQSLLLYVTLDITWIQR